MELTPRAPYRELNIQMGSKYKNANNKAIIDPRLLKFLSYFITNNEAPSKSSIQGAQYIQREKERMQLPPGTPTSSSLKGAQYIHREQILKYKPKTNIDCILQFFCHSSFMYMEPNLITEELSSLLKLPRGSSIYTQGANTKLQLQCKY